MTAASSRKCLVTGADGFVGRVLLGALGGRMLRVLRRPAENPRACDMIVGDIGPHTRWDDSLRDIDCVVHLAARTHMPRSVGADALPEYRFINVEGTRRLAQQAAAAGVRRFVFMSSIKVNGESTTERAFTEVDVPAPEDAYGISKREAEDVLRDIAGQTGMEWVVLRPPLVYGPGVEGNFLHLLKAIDRGLPLPLGSIRNHRSLIHVANLADAIVACIDNPAAAGNTFLVRDDGDISTPDLVRKLAAGLDRPARLLPCPVPLLMLGAALCGKPAAAARLAGSLTVDDSAIRRKLGWMPRISMDQGLIDTARWYHRAQIQPGS